jgi:hypothetical protein
MCAVRTLNCTIYARLFGCCLTVLKVCASSIIHNDDGGFSFSNTQMVDSRFQWRKLLSILQLARTRTHTHQPPPLLLPETHTRSLQNAMGYKIVGRDAAFHVNNQTTTNARGAHRKTQRPWRASPPHGGASTCANAQHLSTPTHNLLSVQHGPRLHRAPPTLGADAATAKPTPAATSDSTWRRLEGICLSMESAAQHPPPLNYLNTARKATGINAATTNSVPQTVHSRQHRRRLGIIYEFVCC